MRSPQATASLARAATITSCSKTLRHAAIRVRVGAELPGRAARILWTSARWRDCCRAQANSSWLSSPPATRQRLDRSVSVRSTRGTVTVVLGQIFVNSGVQFAVCVKREEKILDRSAAAFARSFYHALFVGKCVSEAFEVKASRTAMPPRTAPQLHSPARICRLDRRA
jgi:hypothetical protein